MVMSIMSVIVYYEAKHVVVKINIVSVFNFIERSNTVMNDSDLQNAKHLTFSIDEDMYAIKISCVRQIIGLQKITIIPEQPNYIKGVINLRGQIVPIMDVRIKFNKETIAYDDRTSIIILDVNDIIVGIIVDRVSEVIVIDDADVAETPDFDNGIQLRFIRGIVKLNKKVHILLDCTELIKHDKCDE